MKSCSFRNLKCFVTGAASGIGRALAVTLAGDGALLFLTDRDSAGLDSVVSEIHARGGHVLAHAALDIAEYEAVRAYAEYIHEQHGSMDVVMNVAGIAIWGTVESLEHQHWKKSVDVNLMGPIHVIESFVPAMIAAGRGGHLVNVSSAAGLFGLPWHAAYSASKFGLRGVSEVLRFDLRRHGIAVSLVCPGGVDTGLVGTLEIPGLDTTKPSVQKLRAHFRRRAVSPEVAAEAILAGVRRGRYLVFTSRDIRFGHFIQRKFSLPYELFMRLLNDRFHRLLGSPAARPRDRRAS